MAKQDFETFKMEIRTWLDSHRDEYDAFVKNINSKSVHSLWRLFQLSKRISPELLDKASRDIHGDIVPSEEGESSYMLIHDKTSALISEFSTLDGSSVVPCFLAWLCYGKCFETMVDRLKDLLADQKWLKWVLKYLTKRLVSDSITKHWRTKLDWEEYIMDECSASDYVNNVTKNAIQEVLTKLQGEPILLNKEFLEANPGTPHNENPLEQTIGIQEKSDSQDDATSKKIEDILFCNNDVKGEKKVELLKRIEKRLPLQNQGRNLAYLYVALHQHNYLSCDVTTFYRLLVNSFPKYKCCGFRNIQKFVKMYFSDSFELLSKSSEIKEEFKSIKQYLNVNNITCEENK